MPDPRTLGVAMPRREVARPAAAPVWTNRLREKRDHGGPGWVWARPDSSWSLGEALVPHARRPPSGARVPAGTGTRWGRGALRDGDPRFCVGSFSVGGALGRRTRVRNPSRLYYIHDMPRGISSRRPAGEPYPPLKPVSQSNVPELQRQRWSCSSRGARQGPVESVIVQDLILIAVIIDH